MHFVPPYGGRIPLCKRPRENPELTGNKNMKNFGKQELYKTKLINEINAQ